MNINKHISRILALMITASILLCANLPVSAAVAPAKASGNAGQVITLKYDYPSIAGINGTFKYSSPDVFSDVKFNISGLTTGKYNPETGIIAYFGFAPVNCTITLTLTISEKAKVGDSCTVTFEYETTADGYMPPEADYKYDTVTVTVVEKLDKSALNELIGQADKLKSSSYTAETWQALATALKNAKNVVSSATTQKELNAAADALRNVIGSLQKVTDYTALAKQIKIAEALNEKDYKPASWSSLVKALEAAKNAQSSKDQAVVDAATKELKNAIAALAPLVEINYAELNKQISAAEALKSGDYEKTGWDALTKALQAAKKAKSSKVQSDVDAAANNLKTAIANLVKVDYQRLISAIDAVNDYSENSQFLKLWDEMESLLKEADSALSSRDQKTVDTYAEKLEDLLKKIKEAAGTDSVTVEKPVTVEPTEDYCNIGSHTVWIVLFWISFAINLAFVALALTYYYLKRKKTTDDTPLVDYDITDDAE